MPFFFSSGSLLVSVTPLTARETCQLLRDIALGTRTLYRLGDACWANTLDSTLTVCADGWLITFHKHDDGRFHCERCQSPEDRLYAFDSAQRYGTDPIELLSTWEHARLAQLLAEV
nr:hypothetical protein [Pseudomonas coleopterorum]